MTLEWVSPGTLRLPSSRRDVDLTKLADQYRAFGSSVTGMPPILVTRCGSGQMVINDGVTRATRIARYAPGKLVPVDVQEERPNLDVTHLPRVQDAR
jgi:hypothetical protein